MNIKIFIPLKSPARRAFLFYLNANLKYNSTSDSKKIKLLHNSTGINMG